MSKVRTEQECLNSLVLELAAIVYDLSDEPSRIRITRLVNEAEASFWRMQQGQQP